MVWLSHHCLFSARVIVSTELDQREYELWPKNLCMSLIHSGQKHYKHTSTPHPCPSSDTCFVPSTFPICTRVWNNIGVALAGHVGETLCQEQLYVPLDFFGRNKFFFLSKKLTAFKQKEIRICSINSLETLTYPYFKKQDLLLETKPADQRLKLVGLSSLKSRSSLRYSLPSRNQWLYVRVH